MAKQEWEEFEDIQLASTAKTLALSSPSSVNHQQPDVVPSAVIINVAAETQTVTGNVGISWQLQKENGGMVLAEARLYHADHRGSFAKLQMFI